jgi:NACalpha-BTF3-like transcription factor
MGVIVTRRPDPWWAAPLTQLVTGQIDAMMERTQEAKKVEGQRAFAGMLAQLAQQNPDLSETELYTRAMADPSYSRAGEQGQGMLKQIMAAREKERGERELLALAGGDDPRSRALRAAAAAQKNGLDGKDVMGLFAPKLERRTLNLGNTVKDLMTDPYTGETVGDSLVEQVGMSPDKKAQIDYEKGRDALDFGYKNRELGTRGYETIQGADGQVYFVNPAQGTVKPSGMLAMAKESPDPIAKAIPELLKTYATLASASPDLNPEAAKQAQVVWAILQPFLQRTQGGVGTTQKSSNGGATSNADVEKKIANVMAQTGKSREEIVAALKAKGLL